MKTKISHTKKVTLMPPEFVQSRLDFLYAEEEVLSTVLPWEEAKKKQMTEDMPCRIIIESEDPDAMNGVDPARLSSVMQSRGSVMKPYYDAIDGNTSG